MELYIPRDFEFENECFLKKDNRTVFVSTTRFLAMNPFGKYCFTCFWDVVKRQGDDFAIRVGVVRIQDALLRTSDAQNVLQGLRGLGVLHRKTVPSVE